MIFKTINKNNFQLPLFVMLLELQKTLECVFAYAESFGVSKIYLHESSPAVT